MWIKKTNLRTAQENHQQGDMQFRLPLPNSKKKY